MVSYEVDGLDCDETDAEKADEDKKDDFFLENSWKEIITNNETIPDKQRVQQEAIWELFATEISYIRDIKIIIDVSNFLLNSNLFIENKNSWIFLLFSVLWIAAKEVSEGSVLAIKYLKYYHKMEKQPSGYRNRIILNVITFCTLQSCCVSTWKNPGLDFC